jgi:hypothetical protein
MTLNDLKKYCNSIEINSIILYVYIYSIIVNKFGCDGGTVFDELNYIIYNVLYNTEFITKTCLIHSELCEIIKKNRKH